MVPPAKKLEDLIHLAELCVDLLQQNEEHYAEVNLKFLIHKLLTYLCTSSIISISVLIATLSLSLSLFL